MTFVYKDLFDAIGIVLASLRNESLAHLLEGVLRILIAALHLYSGHNTLLTVAANGYPMLTLSLLLLAVGNILIDGILLLLIFNLQIVLIVGFYLGVGPRSDGYVHATSLYSTGPSTNL